MPRLEPRQLLRLLVVMLTGLIVVVQLTQQTVEFAEPRRLLKGESPGTQLALQIVHPGRRFVQLDLGHPRILDSGFQVSYP